MLYKNRESRTYLLHIERILSQHIAFTYLLQAMVSQVPCKGSENNFCQSLDHGRIATNRRPQDWHQQSFEKNFCQSLHHNRIEIKRKEWHQHLSSMAPLTCELWQDWCSVTFSDLWSQQGKDPWGTPATVSLSDLQELSKNFLSNHVLWSHRKPRWVIASCRSCIQSFDFCPKISLYSVQKAFQQRKHKYCEKKAVDTQREEQNKKNLQLLWSLSTAFVSTQCALGWIAVYCKSCWYI
jgi:hypothetical protein